MRLVLFDVDGTLISSRGVGRRAIARALEEVYGSAGAIDAYDFRGRTDPRIVIDLMLEAGVPEAVVRERLDACFAAYARELERLIGTGECVQAMPGVVDLVHALAARDDALVGLLTGNVVHGARLKLRPTGLLPFFAVGAYGSDDIDRRRLPAIARERARVLAGRDFPFERVTIIGDTPLDVDCARACGAVAVAVATGQHAHDELAACGPDFLFGDFSDVGRALEALTGS
jgi:phosphoglycolate phosphatase-like HAD superfamily hydrolase